MMLSAGRFVSSLVGRSDLRYLHTDIGCRSSGCFPVSSQKKTVSFFLQFCSARSILPHIPVVRFDNRTVLA